ncbi:hypothetical protein [Maricaulis sp.]|uniref:hypothetical protein n=1 Tax=Maricaulis sp. TaxID=1486257 RepID=UPI002B26A914|nr:hypothetical protein [Maricaulis sp.]
MLVALIASLAGFAATEFADDPDQYSVWMQQSCRIQQVGRSGGVPEDHTAFCTCLDREIRAGASGPVYRVFALGSQGAIQDQAMVDDWAAARDTAATEAAMLSPDDQAQIQPVLQSALAACLPQSYQGE